MEGLQDLILGLRHVGYITTDLKASIESFRRVYELSDAQIRVIPGFDEPCETRFAFVELAGTSFELIEPVSDYFKSLLLEDRPGINHVAWNVRDLEAALSRLATRGIRPGHVTPSGIVDLPTFKMVYLDPRTTGGLLIELIEPKG
jgi:catechol 2,3-dioxygenase-like lactoylglutathione lyase family enzyme